MIVTDSTYLNGYVEIKYKMSKWFSITNTLFYPNIILYPVN